MSRVIKFRAWDKVREVMSPVAYINFGDEGLALTVTLKTAPKDTYDSERVHGESAVLMQFTGLTDKNGKEIYEGDVVTAPNYSYDPSEGDSPVIIDSITFVDASFRLKEKNENLDEDESSENIEIIGNIYENPELIRTV